MARKSIDAVLAQQTPSGAFVASPDFSQYGYCWLRDSSFAAYALDRVGESASSAAYHAWVQQTLAGVAGIMEKAIDRRSASVTADPTELLPARFDLEGKVVADDWPNFQIDGYGTWLWALREHLSVVGQAGLSRGLKEVVERTAAYLSAYAMSPCFDVWEMNGEAVHTSTLACVYGGLIAASELLASDALKQRASEVLDFVQSELGTEAGFKKSTLSGEVEASTLWLARPFGLISPDSTRFSAMVERIERHLIHDGGVRRFESDTYFGGGAWPVLTASLGWHYVAQGDLAKARALLARIESHFSPDGLLGEQFGGDTRDPTMFAEWVTRWGPPAQCLTWSHAMHLVLDVEVSLAKMWPGAETPR